MKRIRWSKFRLGPKYWDGEVFIVTHPKYELRVKVKDISAKKSSEPGRCYICGRSSKRLSVKYTIPFNGKFMPGWYCRRCRFRFGIMDIQDAKKYGKI